MRLALVVAGAFVASCKLDAPTQAQIVVTVDTDAPVPTFVDHLRVDVYDGSGLRLIESRDFALFDPTDWPLSFGVRADVPGTPVRLRLRAFRVARASQSGVGTTIEPDPLTSIDLVARTRAPHWGKWQLAATLRAECMGVPAELATSRSCIDRRDQYVNVEEAKLRLIDGDVPRTRVPRWADAGPDPCTRPSRVETGIFDEERCVPGGAFFLGRRFAEGAPCANNLCDAVPERLVVVSPFLLDRYEVSVRRFRAAMNDPVRPFVPPVEPHRHNPAGIDLGFDYRWCTWTGKEAPSTGPSDALPVNCVTFETAQAFCRWSGGDLPTEAQFEYAASSVLRPQKSSYSWGDAPPHCDRAVYSRYADPRYNNCSLSGTRYGPLPVDRPWSLDLTACKGEACAHDETPWPDKSGGIIGLAGNVMEWVQDWRALYSAPCWKDAPRRDPACLVRPAGEKLHMARGGGWAIPSQMLQASLRSGGTEQLEAAAEFGIVGFRCMRPGR